MTSKRLADRCEREGLSDEDVESEERHREGDSGEEQELGDLEGVDALKQKNIPVLARYAREGYAILAPVPSCALMFKQELPLMYPDDPETIAVRDAMFDPFEYLALRHRDGLLIDVGDLRGDGGG